MRAEARPHVGGRTGGTLGVYMGELLFKVGDYLLSSSIKRALTSAGIGLFTYKGLDILVERLMSQAMQELQGLSQISIAFMGMAGIDTCLSITFSAILARVAIIQSRLFLDKI